MLNNKKRNTNLENLMWPILWRIFQFAFTNQQATCAMKACNRMLYMFFRRFSSARLINIASHTRYRVRLSCWLSTYFTFCERKIKKTRDSSYTKSWEKWQCTESPGTLVIVPTKNSYTGCAARQNLDLRTPSITLGILRSWW